MHTNDSFVQKIKIRVVTKDNKTVKRKRGIVLFLHTLFDGKKTNLEKMRVVVSFLCITIFSSSSSSQPSRDRLGGSHRTTTVAVSCTSTTTIRMDPPPRTLARGGSHNKNNRKRQRLLRQRQRHARSLWLQATCLQDMERVEHLYQSVYYDNDNDYDTPTKPNADPTTRPKRPRIDKHDPKDDDDDNIMDTLEHEDEECGAAAASCPRRRAGEQLALWYLQSGRVAQADALLSELDYTCRLSSNVFAPLDSAVLVPVDKSSSSVTTSNTTSLPPSPPPCRIWDEFLTHEEYTILHSIFANPQASYWTDHDYHVEPTPSPYFSYAIPLQPPPPTLQRQPLNDDDSLPYVVREYGFLGHLIHKVWKHLLDLDHDHDNNTTTGAPSSSLLWRPHRHALHQCTHVELWAHNRPAVTGHQLHFDSDQEGQTAVVRHPLVSTVLYLSSESSSSSSRSNGGATLVTNQRRVSRHVAQTAWLCPPAPRRCVAFDGRVLHGVVPGTVHDKQQPQSQQPSSSSSSPKREPEPPPHDTRNNAVSPDTPTNHDNNHNNNNAPSHSNRVTLMLAFWKELQVRPATTTSTNNDNNTNNHHKIVPGASRPLPTHTEWAKALRQPYTPSINSKKEPQMTSRLPLVLSPVYECVVPPPSPSPSPSQQQSVTTTLSCTATTTTTTTTTRSTGQPWTRAMGMPSYDQVFQGF